MNIRHWPFALSFVLFLTMTVYRPAFARPGMQQEDTGWIGAVTGTVVNMNAAETSPEDVQIMLHAWDENYTQKFMLHGEMAEDGTFRFEEVPLEEGLYLSVMVIYREASYFSDPATVTPDLESIRFEVPVYETKSDLGGLQIDQMHVVFYFEGGGLGVTEVYILSNLSDHAISEAVVWNDANEAATLAFDLPEGASEIQFNSDDDSRFLITPEGFVDTAPVVPGLQSGQVVVSYFLPYEDAKTLSFAPPLPVMSLDFLVDAASEVKLAGLGLNSGGVQSLQDGTRFEIFSGGSLQAGESIQVELSGEPVVGTTTSGATMGTPATNGLTSGQSFAIGGIFLGLALIGAGFWWFRSREASDEAAGEGDRRPSEEPNAVDALIGEIAALDQALEDGKIAAVEHHNLRIELLAGLRDLLATQPDGALD